ncbi:unnamed protein product [Adineta steineri]|uniref:Uncharacterized protein n=1 Tax=Adineta steineri TaxID=433720 RepID=A0A815TKS9_9BILA|nr:unnamed protein product [Adineta steineri]CAF1263539.1 unnamed protein product [Adineta steineri]CAF1291300.1 unnamed protein product [Adineta steineri]CAF1296741.1 unnamed protein product [Adineta steineri]CAF1503523.1 unnamed protein product [Adineta steineri]
MKVCFFFVITLIICQYFISQISVDARPAELKRFSWSFPIHEDQEDNTYKELVKRKGVGWGKRSDSMLGDHPYAVHENSARTWFEDK